MPNNKTLYINDKIKVSLISWGQSGMRDTVTSSRYAYKTDPEMAFIVRLF